MNEAIPFNRKNLEEYLASHPPKGFKPIPFTNVVGNMIEWYFSDEHGYAEPVHVDGVLVGTLIRSFETNEVVGVKICLESVK